MFKLPDLPYSFKALEPYIDTLTMQIHHDKHHATYVENLNKALSGHDDLLKMDITELIKNLNEVPQDLRTKVRNNGGGQANHTLFWVVMAPKAGGEPEGKLAEAIKSAFGDFKTFQEKFTQAGMGRFGSGWTWLVVKDKKFEILDTPNQDSPLMDNGGTPILGLDIWEHAYYLKYQNRRADYIAAWWNVVNWQEVSRRFEETQS